MTFLTILGVTEICSFRLVLEGKTVKRYQNHQDYSSQKRFKQIILLKTEDNTSRLFNRGVVDLHLLRTKLRIHQRVKFLKSDEFFCFSSICKFGSFKNILTTITCLSELQIQKIYSAGTNKKNDFYELWQEHNQLKTIEMSEV